MCGRNRQGISSRVADGTGTHLTLHTASPVTKPPTHITTDTPMKTTSAFDEPPFRSGITHFVLPEQFPFFTTPPGETSLLSFLPEDASRAGRSRILRGFAPLSPPAPTVRSWDRGEDESSLPPPPPEPCPLAELSDEAEIAVMQAKLDVAIVESNLLVIDMIHSATKHLLVAQRNLRSVLLPWRKMPNCEPEMSDRCDRLSEGCDDIKRIGIDLNDVAGELVAQSLALLDKPLPATPGV